MSGFLFLGLFSFLIGILAVLGGDWDSAIAGFGMGAACVAVSVGL